VTAEVRQPPTRMMISTLALLADRRFNHGYSNLCPDAGPNQ
jgi:hypothetical protein